MFKALQKVSTCKCLDIYYHALYKQFGKLSIKVLLQLQWQYNLHSASLGGPKLRVIITRTGTRMWSVQRSEGREATNCPLFTLVLSAIIMAS